VYEQFSIVHNSMQDQLSSLWPSLTSTHDKLQNLTKFLRRELDKRPNARSDAFFPFRTHPLTPFRHSLPHPVSVSTFGFTLTPTADDRCCTRAALRTNLRARDFGLSDSRLPQYITVHTNSEQESGVDILQSQTYGRLGLRRDCEYFFEVRADANPYDVSTLRLKMRRRIVGTRNQMGVSKI